MSSFVCGEKTFNIIYNGLNQYVLKNSFISSKVFDELSEGGFVYDNAENLINIFYHLNQVATCSRYEDKIDLLDLNVENFKIENVDIALFYRCLCCLDYQSSEDLKIKKFNHIYKALEIIKISIAEKIAYEASKKFDIWGE